MVEVVDKYFIQNFFVHNLLEGLIIPSCLEQAREFKNAGFGEGKNKRG